jgi:hypothetical protein
MIGELINLTPHPINIKTSTGEIIEIPSSGEARCDPKTMVVDALVKKDWSGSPITVTKVELGDVVGLPPEEEGKYYFVSRPVAEKLKGLRNDLVVSGTSIRDEKGRPIACDGVSIVG